MLAGVLLPAHQGLGEEIRAVICTTLAKEKSEKPEGKEPGDEPLSPPAWDRLIPGTALGTSGLTEQPTASLMPHDCSPLSPPRLASLGLQPSAGC